MKSDKIILNKYEDLMKFIRSYSADFNSRILLKNIIFSFLVAIITLFIGLTINFFLVYSMPGDPVLGLDQPLFIQFFRFISDLFRGQWGISDSINQGQAVWELNLERFPRLFELLMLPTILGLVFGIVLGKISIIFRKKWIEKVIQGFIAIGIAIPVFFFGLLLQLIFLWRMEAIPFLYNGRDYYLLVLDYILPFFCLTIVTLAFITKQTRSNMEKEQREKSVISNTMITGMTFGMIVAFYLLVEIVFNMHGISDWFLRALVDRDFFSLKVIIFDMIILFVVITFISNIIFSINKSLTFHRQNSMESISNPAENNNSSQTEKDPETDSKRDLRKYLKFIYKSPYILIGLILVCSAIIISIFPQLISGYSFEDAVNIYTGWWDPPSPEHPLGQTSFGRDVFARLLYGTQFALLIGLGAVLIGILGGLIFGLISSLHRYVSRAVEGIMIVTCIIPGLILIISTVFIFGRDVWVLIPTMGILLIPSFTRIMTNVPLHKRNVMISLKKLVIYIPLQLGLVILISESVGFLGYADPYFNIIQLGRDVDIGRGHLINSPWASLWPGFTIFFIVLGLVILHFGLKNTFLDRLNSSRIPENNI